MAKITFKVPKKAFDAAGDRGDFEQPQPGVYIGKLTSCEPHNAQGDKTRPSLECIYQIVGVGRENEPPDKNYSQLWDYVSMKPGEDSDWKRAQFALAMGLADGSKAFSGTVETKEFLGTLVVMRVKKDSDNDGNYRGKIGYVGPFEGDEGDAFDAGDDEVFGGEDEATEDEDVLYDEADLVAMDRDEFKALCDEYDIVTKGKRKSELITLVLEAQAAAVDAEASGAEDDDDEPF